MIAMRRRLREYLPQSDDRSLQPARDRAMAAAAGGIVGMGLMYLFDPSRGNRRRAVLRDKVTHWRLTGGDAAGTTARDMRNRISGLVADTRQIASNEPVDDVVLEERVRAKLGRVVSHPHAVQVHAKDGHVTLSGPILERETDQLLSSIRKVRGVREVEDSLDVHKRAENIPGLQGGARRPGDQMEFFQETWSPSARFIATALGGTLAFIGLRRRSLPGAALASGGAILAARGLTNIQPKRLFGFGGGRKAVDFHQTINVDAPVADVYDLWTKFEQYPRFMSHVRKITDNGQGQLHWVVDGPPGMTVEWDAEITQQIPHETVAWKSLPGSVVQHAGIARFQEIDGGTRVDIHMTYNPPAGAAGHAVAALFGRDPKHAMADDLMRFKSIIEQGKATADGQTVTQDEVMSEHPS